MSSTFQQMIPLPAHLTGVVVSRQSPVGEHDSLWNQNMKKSGPCQNIHDAPSSEVSFCWDQMELEDPH